MNMMTPRLAAVRGRAFGIWTASLIVAAALSAQAQVTVKKEDIKDDLYAFKAVGAALENVGGAMEVNNNIGYNAWPYQDGPFAGELLHYLYADSKSGAAEASFVLKWDFSQSGRLVSEVEIPNNRIYFQYEPASSVSEILATISYSVDGKEWIELDQFAPDISALTPEQPVKTQNSPLYVSLDTPAATFYYKVEFHVQGGALYGQAFQWQRMAAEPDYMRPDYFAVNFILKPN